MEKHYISIFFILIFTLISGCHRADSPSPPPVRLNTNVSTKPSSNPTPLDCYAEPFSQKAGSNESISIKLVVDNIGFDVLLTAETEWSADPWYIKATYNGAPIGFSGQGKMLVRKHAAESWQITGLGPGKRMETSLLVSDLFDLSNPGEYSIKFSRKFWKRGGSEKTSFVCSARATILVVEKQQVR